MSTINPCIECRHIPSYMIYKEYHLIQCPNTKCRNSEVYERIDLISGEDAIDLWNEKNPGLLAEEPVIKVSELRKWCEEEIEKIKYEMDDKHFSFNVGNLMIESLSNVLDKFCEGKE